MYQPLADELRPTTLDDVYGQEEILGEGRMLPPDDRVRPRAEPDLLRPERHG